MNRDLVRVAASLAAFFAIAAVVVAGGWMFVVGVAIIGQSMGF